MKRKIINPQDVINFLTDHPCSKVDVIAEHIGVSQNSMRCRLRCMVAEGQITTRKINGCLYYSAKPELPFGMNPNSMLFNTLLAKVKPLRGAVA